MYRNGDGNNFCWIRRNLEEVNKILNQKLLRQRSAIGKLKSYKFPGTIQIPVELIRARSETLCSERYKLIHSVWNLLLYQFIKRMIRLTNNYYQLPTKFYPTFFWLG
jgi:hypothetical protein